MGMQTRIGSESIGLRGVVGVVLVILVAGCSSSSPVSPVDNDVLQSMHGGKLCGSLKDYRVVTVMPFEAQTAAEGADQCGKVFAHYIYLNLSYDYSHVFDRIIADKPLWTDNELVISGQILRYQPGSKFARRETFGILGTVQFDANLILTDGKTKDMICKVPISEFWGGWDDIVGIGDLMRKDAEAVAEAIVRLKSQNL